MATGRLTAKQAKFVAEYLIDLNATQAAIRAGYSVLTAGAIGHENLKKPEIQAAVNAAAKERSKRTEITQDYVLNGIREVIERCLQKVPVLDDDGNETGEWRFEPNPSLKGYELLGKHLKLFTEVHEHNLAEGFAEALKKARERASRR